MNSRVCLLLALAWVAFSVPLQADGTLTVTGPVVIGPMLRYTITWTSTAGGAASGNTFTVRRGNLEQIEFVPDAAGTQPSDLYDVTLVDTHGVDVLNGSGANLSNALSKRFLWDPPLFWDPAQTLDFVVANAGATKGGKAYLWVRG